MTLRRCEGLHYTAVSSRLLLIKGVIPTPHHGTEIVPTLSHVLPLIICDNDIIEFFTYFSRHVFFKIVNFFDDELRQTGNT